MSFDHLRWEVLLTSLLNLPTRLCMRRYVNRRRKNTMRGFQKKMKEIRSERHGETSRIGCSITRYNGAESSASGLSVVMAFELQKV